MTCEHCGGPGRMSTEEFKAAFKVGDRITGKWSTGKIVKITAIGNERFLYENDNKYRVSECVTKMALQSGRWRKA